MIKVGIGQDSHRFDFENPDQKPLVLAGIVFEGPCLKANSDGDVVLHALTNAISSVSTVNILGPISDQLCQQGIKDSAVYLQLALESLAEKNLHLVHIAISIEAQKPKIYPKILSMQKHLAALCNLDETAIGISATTGEQLTSFGKGLGIASHVIVTCQSIEKSGNSNSN